MIERRAAAFARRRVERGEQAWAGEYRCGFEPAVWARLRFLRWLHCVNRLEVTPS